MKVLNFFYENHPKFEVSYERKNQISKPNIIIKGPRFCGKKTLIFNFLSQFKASEILFLDLYDTRFEKQSLERLADFLNENLQIKILCLYNLDFIPNLEKINIPIILSTNIKDLNVNGFEELELDYFDFEEFISVSKKNLPINLKKRLDLGEISDFDVLNDIEIKSEIAKQILEILNDDLNVSKALALLDDFISSANLELDKESKNKILKQNIKEALSELAKIFGFGFMDTTLYFQWGVSKEEREEIEKLILERTEAKKNKDFNTADAIREQ